MATSLLKTCRKTRYRCVLCDQELGYCAYRRHRDLPSRYCPGFLKKKDERDRSGTEASDRSDSDSEASSDSTFIADNLIDHENSVDWNPEYDASQSSDTHMKNMDSSSTTNGSMSSSESTSFESESGPEVWDDDEPELPETSSDETDEGTGSEVQKVKDLKSIVCLFFGFFQLFFRVSDRAIVCLLTFLSSFLKQLSTLITDNQLLFNFVSKFPTTLYSLRKHIIMKGSYKIYVVCPKCHKLY